jgi:hypothetical protein
MTLMVRRDSLHWAGFGGSGQEGRFGAILSSYRDRAPLLEWRAYMLDSPPEC